MTVAVVEGLEVVDVDEKKRAARLARGAEGLELRIQAPAVADTGQGIGHRQISERAVFRRQMFVPKSFHKSVQVEAPGCPLKAVGSDQSR